MVEWYSNLQLIRFNLNKVTKMEDAEAKLYKIIKEMNMYGSHGKYISPEEEAKNIKKCSILQDVPIEYSYFSESSPKIQVK